MPDVISPLLDVMNLQEAREALLQQPQFQAPFLIDYLAVFLWAVNGAPSLECTNARAQQPVVPPVFSPRNWG
jgi:hypothetical protein